MSDSDSDEDDSELSEWDPPTVSPEIRKEFEAALGAFILAFNEADFYVGWLLKLESQRVGRLHLYDAKAFFWTRLALLEAMAAGTENLSDLPFASLREIASARNKLAHGHFAQDPYNGDYRLISRAKAKEFPAAEVIKLTNDLTEINVRLNFATAPYDMLSVLL